MLPLLQIAIPRNTRAPWRARRAVEAFAGDLATDAAADVKLMVTELVTNSVKYGGTGDISLALRSDEHGHLHAEVSDGGGGFMPEARDRPATDVGGWGLHLVQTLSDRWGVSERGARVWFEVDAFRDRGRTVAAA